MIERAGSPASVAGELRLVTPELGSDCYVAVRSSGAAEDLAGTSLRGTA